jgi:3-oxoacyl-[acyl-carrier protein] reductase
MSLLLEGKKVLVTGGSRGIGRAICEVFAREGADVALCYAASGEAAEEAAAAVRQHGREALAMRADVASREQSERLIDQVVGAFGRIDVLVLNAGINRTSMFARMPESDWDDIMAVNVGQLYNVGKPVFRQMMRQRGGHMLAITSISGIRTAPAGVPYAVSKAAAVGFVKAIAREGGAFGIRANGIAVGVVETDLADQIPERFLETLKNWAAIGRLGHVNETAELAAFLVSDRNSYMSGEIVIQDGGAVT